MTTNTLTKLCLIFIILSVTSCATSSRIETVVDGDTRVVTIKNYSFWKLPCLIPMTVKDNGIEGRPIDMPKLDLSR